MPRASRDSSDNLVAECHPRIVEFPAELGRFSRLVCRRLTQAFRIPNAAGIAYLSFCLLDMAKAYRRSGVHCGAPPSLRVTVCIAWPSFGRWRSIVDTNWPPLTVFAPLLTALGVVVVGYGLWLGRLTRRQLRQQRAWPASTDP